MTLSPSPRLLIGHNSCCRHQWQYNNYNLVTIRTITDHSFDLPLPLPGLPPLLLHEECDLHAAGRAEQVRHGRDPHPAQWVFQQSKSYLEHARKRIKRGLSISLTIYKWFSLQSLTLVTVFGCELTLPNTRASQALKFRWFFLYGSYFQFLVIFVFGFLSLPIFGSHFMDRCESTYSVTALNFLDFMVVFLEFHICIS